MTPAEAVGVIEVGLCEAPKTPDEHSKWRKQAKIALEVLRLETERGVDVEKLSDELVKNAKAKKKEKFKVIPKEAV